MQTNCNKTILIVDDVELNRALLCQMFQDMFVTAQASNGREAVEYIENHLDDIEVILLDVKMEDMDGFQVVEYMREKGYTSTIPVIFITGDEDGNAMERGYELGVVDVIFKPFQASVVIQRVKNILEFFRHKNHLEELVQEQTKELTEQNLRLQEYYYQIVELFQRVIKYRNVENSKHIAYVQGYTEILARQYAKLYSHSKMTEEKIQYIVQASKLHDIGKIVIPDSILKEAGHLSSWEMEYLKEHTDKGAKIINIISEFENEEYRRICYNVCKYHHTKYDGSGYPNDIRKDRIPVEAQLVALADMYDALAHMEEKELNGITESTYEILVSGACGELSPKMQACLEASKEQLESFCTD